MNHAFGSCSELHDSSSDAISLHEVVNSVNELLPSVANENERKRLSDELNSLVAVHTQYVAHLLCTKHQADYFKFVLKNLQPSEAVVIVDYKMKLELGICTREIQCDWYGK